jgi:ATP adenylyltransferase
MERLLGSCRLSFRHAFARIVPPATAPVLHAVYRELLNRCGISAVAGAEGEFQSAPYNLLVRRSWMLVVPRSRACFEPIPVNALGFVGSLFVRSQEDLERVRSVGPMHVLCAVAVPRDGPALQELWIAPVTSPMAGLPDGTSHDEPRHRRRRRDRWSLEPFAAADGERP